MELDRRDFFKGAGALAGLSLAGCSTVPPRRAFGPNDKLRHACIGVGGMGFNDLRNFLSHPRVEVAALCDVDSNNLARAAQLAPNARTYADWREMLEKEDIDSVNIAVPDHQHAIIALAAMLFCWCFFIPFHWRYSLGAILAAVMLKWIVPNLQNRK